MSRSSLEYLKHIIEEADYLIEESGKVQYDDFLNDQNLTRAFVRSLEIIGEASKNIDQTLRDKYPEVKSVKQRLHLNIFYYLYNIFIIILKRISFSNLI